MISIEMCGGLGNQLFQVFTLLGYALDHKVDFQLPENVSFGSRTKTYWKTLLSALQDKVVEQESFFITLKNKILRKPRSLIYQGPRDYYEPIPTPPSHRNYQLTGYFQSYKYFDHHKEQIVNILRLKELQESVVEKIRGLSCKDAISLHFRLGDFKEVQGNHFILPVGYYINALSTVVEKTQVEDWQVLCFFELEDQKTVQDAIRKLKQKFPKMIFHLLPLKIELEDWEEMLAMSLCHHHIIANSTFSYFGAYLSQNKENLVCYPSQWRGSLLPPKNTSDLCPDRWVKVSV